MLVQVGVSASDGVLQVGENGGGGQTYASSADDAEV